MDVQHLRNSFKSVGYIADETAVMTTFLALSLQKPLLIEGAPGVGKTEMAKALSTIFNTELIRLQCYEGLDENRALYEWNYQRQLLKIQLQNIYTNNECQSDNLEKNLFNQEYLLERPLLKALTSDKQIVLLIDEIDKTDEQFEAFLFEFLSEFQISIPELGTISAKHSPIVVLTSNNERELSDGLRRRCVYLYLNYPSIDKEVAILKARIPDMKDKLVREITAAIAVLRNCNEIEKKPAISETLDWARSLIALGVDSLNETVIRETLGILLKRENDLLVFNQQIGEEQLLKLTREYLQQERKV